MSSVLRKSVANQSTKSKSVKKFLQDSANVTLFGKSVHPDDNKSFFDALDKYPEKRTDSDMQLLKLLIADIQALQTIPSTMFDGICKHLKHKHIARKQLVVQKGDKSEEAYIVANGNIDVEVGNGIVVFNFNPGDFFGDYGLQNEDSKRTADCRARTDVDVLCVPRHIYIKYMMEHMHGNRDLKKKFFLRSLKFPFWEINPKMNDDNFTEQMNWMGCKSYKKGSNIALQGQPSKKIYFVVSGLVQVLRTVFVEGQPMIFEIGRYSKGFAFGCNFSSINEVNVHTWRAQMNTTIYSISRGDFQRKFGRQAVDKYKQHTNVLLCSDKELRFALKTKQRWEKYKKIIVQGLKDGQEPDWSQIPLGFKKGAGAREIAVRSHQRCGIPLQEFQ